MSRPMPGWAVAAAVAIFCGGTFALDRAELFPEWQLAAQWSPAAVASAAAVTDAAVAEGLPLLSLTLPDAALHDPVRGLLANRLQRGRDWEREGAISYFEAGRLRFASAVGVRVHGESSRRTAPRSGYRIYLRGRYGARQLPRGLIFSPAADPVRRFVVHDDYRLDRGVHWRFVNPLAYDVARAVGALVPETRPVQFYVNGERQGPFVLTERLDDHYFAARRGPQQVVADEAGMRALREWVAGARPLTMDGLAARIDIENLVRWFVSVAFAATRDAYQLQGQYRDTGSGGRWFWVNWDMDQSFRDWNLDSYQLLLEPVGEGRRGRHRDEVRAQILTELIAHDPRFRAYLKRMVQHALNHQLTPAFLAERYEHYLGVATALRSPDLDYLPTLRGFFERRPEFFRLLTEQWTNTPPSQPLRVIAPAAIQVEIDGVAVDGGYRGWYFPDLEISASLPDPAPAGFRGWRLNDGPLDPAPVLTFRVTGPTALVAVFDGHASAPPAPARSPAPPPAPVSAPRWVAVPAGAFWMGCVPADTRCDEVERPRVRVTIDAPYELLQTEVTADQFADYAAAADRPLPRQPVWYARGDHPVVNVTWDEAAGYCAWLGGRLPSEEEWERGARGGADGRLFPWGDTYAGDANARHLLPSERWEFSAPVASFPANAYGLRDMAGNVWEWTSTPFTRAHGAPPEARPYDLRTIRGGSWDSTIPRLRASERSALSREGRHNLYVGFRCARGAAAVTRR